VGIFMDISKAFDSISHNVLLKKLKYMGIEDIQLKWFQSYLTNRKQYVEISHTHNNKVTKVKSQTKIIKHGVPQGSILGPLLFICYMKNMPDYLQPYGNVKNELCLYADDSNLIISSKIEHEVEMSAYLNLSNLHNFFIGNKLLLNTEKTNFISFHTKQSRKNHNPLILVNENEVVKLNETKFLGLIIDKNLSWDKHIDHIVKKINSGLYVLRRMAYVCEMNVLKLIYHAHIQSHIAYGISVYGGTSNQNLKKILILQKKALRIMLKIGNDESVKDQFRELKILTVFSLYIFECIMLVRNHSLEFTSHGEIHQYNTRNKNEKVLPQHKLEYFKKKPSYAGLKFLQAIPKEIKETPNNNKFKSLLKEFLINKACYAIEDLIK